MFRHYEEGCLPKVGEIVKFSDTDFVYLILGYIKKDRFSYIELIRLNILSSASLSDIVDSVEFLFNYDMNVTDLCTFSLRNIIIYLDDTTYKCNLLRYEEKRIDVARIKLWYNKNKLVNNLLSDMNYDNKVFYEYIEKSREKRKKKTIVLID